MKSIPRSIAHALAGPALTAVGLLLPLCGWPHPGSGIVAHADGRVYVAYGHSIIRIATNGAADVLISDPSQSKLRLLHHLFLLRDGSLYTAPDFSGQIWRVTLDGKMSSHFPPPNDMRSFMVGLGGDPFALDDAGNIYAVNAKQNAFTQILKISRHGQIAVLAGSGCGHADGKGEQAKFGDLHGSSMALAMDGTLYLTDDRRYVRNIAPDGTVTTLAGGPQEAFADGLGTHARFHAPHGLALNSSGEVFVADTGNHRIRKISRDGHVTTIAGDGSARAKDGPAAEAGFSEPTGVAVGSSGIIYVLEFSDQRVRQIADDRVTTLIKGFPEPPASARPKP